MSRTQSPGGSYTLEVSSPGLDRKLVRPADYKGFTGSRVKLTIRRQLLQMATGILKEDSRVLSKDV